MMALYYTFHSFFPSSLKLIVPLTTGFVIANLCMRLPLWNVEVLIFSIIIIYIPFLNFSSTSSVFCLHLLKSCVSLRQRCSDVLNWNFVSCKLSLSVMSCFRFLSSSLANDNFSLLHVPMYMQAMCIAVHH